MRKAIISFSLGALSLCALGAGFGLYEMSARAMMTGGNNVGKATDASAVYYNPATMGGLTGTWVTVGTTFLRPPLDTRVNGVGAHKMDPGWFVDPHAFITHQLPCDFTAGLGFYADFGLGSHYDNSWPLAFDSVESTVEGFTLSPTLSYKVTDKWSVGGGVRLTRLNFEQRRIYRFDDMVYRRFGMVGVPGAPSGTMKLRYDAHNDVDVGYLVGTTYDLTEDFTIGAVWRSRIRARMEGKCHASGDNAYSMATARLYGGSLEEKIDLPMSANVGFNWNRAFWLEHLRMGGTATWTEWSTIDEICLGAASMNLGWHNAYRTGFGFEYDLTDWWTPGIGYCYDWDPTKEKRPTTMLPAGDRHNIYFGSTFHITENWDFTISGGMVLMESKTAHYNDPVGNLYKFQTRNSHTYLASATITYHF